MKEAARTILSLENGAREVYEEMVQLSTEVELGVSWLSCS
jgi:hypothetical protein